MVAGRILTVKRDTSHLLQSFVVDKASRIFGKIELPALNLLSELPLLNVSYREQGKLGCRNVAARRTRGAI